MLTIPQWVVDIVLGQLPNDYVPPHDPFMFINEAGFLLFFGSKVPDPGGDWDGPWDTLAVAADDFLLDLLRAATPGHMTAAEAERQFNV